jgi:hypothetical protein
MCLFRPETNRGVQTSGRVLILSPAGTYSVVVLPVAFELVGFHGDYC